MKLPPLVADMKFWSLIISILALVLSQWKFFSSFWRRANLNVELHNLAFITHKYGNPNFQSHIALSNTGGRKIRVKGIRLTLKPSTREQFSIIASTYQKQGDEAQLLLTPFSLAPGDEWSHHVLFWNPLARHAEKRVKEAKIALREDIAEKRESRSEEDKNNNKAVVADAHIVAPLLQLFEEQFKWFPDDYEAALSFDTEPINAVKEQRFRFVLFESDTAEMRAVTKNYTFGAGVFFKDESDEGVITPIQKIRSEN